MAKSSLISRSSDQLSPGHRQIICRSHEQLPPKDHKSFLKKTSAQLAMEFSSPRRGGAHPYMGEVVFRPGLTQAFHLDRLHLLIIIFFILIFFIYFFNLF